MSVAFLVIAILAAELIGTVAAAQTTLVDVAAVIAATIVGIAFVMAIGVTLRIAKWSKAQPPFGWFPVGSVNAAITLAMDTVNANYLYTTKSKITKSPQKLIKSNGSSRKI